MERQISHRVPCPTCGAWAQLRLSYRDDRPPIAVMLSCPNQTSRDHAVPTRQQIRELIDSLTVVALA